MTPLIEVRTKHRHNPAEIWIARDPDTKRIICSRQIGYTRTPTERLAGVAEFYQKLSDRMEAIRTLER